MMMPVFAIVKKDMRAFLTSPMFYTLLGLCVLLWSIFFSIDMYNFIAESFRQSSGKAETGLNVHQNLISNYIVLVHYVLVFIIAAFTIKFFTEEKRVKTFSLLLSSPLASWQLVLAKLMVGACVLILLLAVSAVLPLSLGFFVHIPVLPFLTTYFGAFLVLMVYMSAGLLASALTDSLIVCVVLSLVLNIALLLLGVGREFFASPAAQSFFHFLSIDYHFSFFRGGSLSLASCLFFLSLILFFSVVSERVIEMHRWR